MRIGFTTKHPFHLVDPSPWPIVVAIGAVLTSTTGGVMYMHGYEGGGRILGSGMIIMIGSLVMWWRDVIREGTLEGQHTSMVQLGLRLGMILFIISEVMFFLAFFWGFFWSSLNPTAEIGGIWPPKGIETMNAAGIPLLNTLILLSSGATITWSHHAIVAGRRKETIKGLILTIVLAITFTGLQVFEYFEAKFNISDGVYGSTFYMATGFHGFHVIIGTCFIIVCLIRIVLNQITKQHHAGFEFSAWYWHFVDVVWLGLFISVYWWGS